MIGGGHAAMLLWLDFPVQARTIIDNSSTETGNPDSLNRYRYSMGTAHSFDPGHVTWATTTYNSTVAGTNCTNVYTDWARLKLQDEQASGIGAGLIGIPSGYTFTNGLVCGGTTANMFQMPTSHTQPKMVDLHMYPCVTQSFGSPCYSTDSKAAIQGESTIFFSDVTHLLALLNMQSAIFVVGETHSNTNNGNGLSCEPAVLAPYTSAATGIVNGYNASSLAGHTTYIRPWSNLDASCYSYTPPACNSGNQRINCNNAGPYTPTQQ
jgi:hypothetical protein